MAAFFYLALAAAFGAFHWLMFGDYTDQGALPRSVAFFVGAAILITIVI